MSSPDRMVQAEANTGKAEGEVVRGTNNVCGGCTRCLATLFLQADALPDEELVEMQTSSNTFAWLQGL